MVGKYDTKVAKREDIHLAYSSAIIATELEVVEIAFLKLFLHKILGNHILIKETGRDY